jgi:hypothetical protein
MWHGCYWSSKLCRAAPLTGPGSLKRRQPRLPKHNTSSQHLSDFLHFLRTSFAHSPSPIHPPSPSHSPTRVYTPSPTTGTTIKVRTVCGAEPVEVTCDFVRWRGRERAAAAAQQHRLAIGNEDYDYGNSRTRQCIQPLRPADIL